MRRLGYGYGQVGWHRITVRPPKLTVVPARTGSRAPHRLHTPATRFRFDGFLDGVGEVELSLPAIGGAGGSAVGGTVGRGPVVALAAGFGEVGDGLGDHGRVEARSVWRDLRRGPCWAAFAGRGRVAVDEITNGVGVERATASGGEQRPIPDVAEFGHPCAEDLNGVPGEWCASFLEAFPETANVRAGAEHDVLAAQPGQFGHA